MTTEYHRLGQSFWVHFGSFSTWEFRRGTLAIRLLRRTIGSGASSYNTNFWILPCLRPLVSATNWPVLVPMP